MRRTLLVPASSFFLELRREHAPLQIKNLGTNQFQIALNGQKHEMKLLHLMIQVSRSRFELDQPIKNCVGRQNTYFLAGNDSSEKNCRPADKLPDTFFNAILRPSRIHRAQHTSVRRTKEAILTTSAKYSLSSFPAIRSLQQRSLFSVVSSFSFFPDSITQKCCALELNSEIPRIPCKKHTFLALPPDKSTDANQYAIFDPQTSILCPNPVAFMPDT